MNFKIQLTIFPQTEEKRKTLYGENYDPKKNYPEFSGIAKIESTQIKTFIEYLSKATPDFDEYTKTEYVPVQADGWMNKSEKGMKYLVMNLTPNYKKAKQIVDGVAISANNTDNIETNTESNDDFAF
tara:strand:- start:778 stop:1158 length:381 start_codon:yes stop_codon:yes gene_type:complete